MKIALILTNYIEPDRINQSYIFDLAVTLKKVNTSLELELFFLTKNNCTYKVSEILVREFSVKRFPADILGLSFFLQYSHNLIKFFKKNAINYDIIHINGISSYLLEPLLLVLAQSKTHIVLHARGFGSRFFHAIKIFLIKYFWLKRKNTYLIVENSFFGKIFLKNKDKIFLIPGLFNLSSYGFYDRNQVLTNDFKKCRFGFFGRITQKKGIKILVKSFLEVHKIYPNVTLFFYGYGDLEQYVQQYNSEGIFYKGTFNRNNIQEKFLSIDCFLYPTLSDSFPIGVLEAVFYEKPIIASDNPGIREIKHICHGLITTENRFLTETILKTIENPHFPNIQMDKKNMLRVCESRIIGQKIIQVYKKISRK